MSDATKAVFLSYAREDTDAARRIADALRSQGLEVWFDQNELRGGDAWDSKIRQQINDCALFLPIISQHTQGRSKGYFRLEWKLAVEQTHLMLEGVPYLAPIVIDDTSESGAAVPAEFMKVQWTRLPGALPTPQFVEQIKRLLTTSVSPSVTAPPMSMRPAHATAPAAPAVPATAPAAKSSFPLGIVATLVVVVLALVGYIALRPAGKESLPPAAPAKPVAETKSAPAAAPAVSDKSIAVLPFANLSTEKENEYFADGVHHDVISNLAKIRDLKVISRTSVLAYRDPASRNMKRIAAELGVAAVLEGSIRRVGSKVHMNAELINARTDEHLWADTFDGDAADIFALQASLAQKIAAALKATLTPSERTLIERRPTQNQEAYDLFLRARAMHQDQGERGTTAEFERVVAAYERAIAKDPSFALAHAQVALVHSVMYWFGFLDPSPARAQRMKSAVDAAVRLAPEAPETHLAVGSYHYRVNRDWKSALADFKLAEAGLPNDAQLFFWLAIANRRLGHWTEASDYFAHSAALNPRDLAPVANYVGFLVNLRRADEAVAATTRFLSFFPNERELLESQAQAAFAGSGDRAAYARMLAALPPDPANPAGATNRYRAAFWLGDFAAADRALVESRLESLTDNIAQVINDPVQMYRALLAALRGDHETARRLADQSIDFYRRQRWNGRQQAWVAMRIAHAEALAGRKDEAIRDGQAALARMIDQDAYDAKSLRESLGEIYVLVGRHDDAIATLRELMKGPCNLCAHEFRIHPLWMRLKDDPRFEEILRSAKPL